MKDDVLSYINRQNKNTGPADKRNEKSGNLECIVENDERKMVNIS